MRLNLTKKDLVNSIYMQIGFSKKITELIIDDFFNIILDELITNNKVKIARFGTFILRKKKRTYWKKSKNKRNCYYQRKKCNFI